MRERRPSLSPMRRLVAVIAVSTALLLGACGGSTEGLFGEDLYQRSCAGCHRGDGGGGRGPAIGPGSRAALELSDDQLAGVIITGPGAMPAFGRFSEEQVASLVAHLRELQTPGG